VECPGREERPEERPEVGPEAARLAAAPLHRLAHRGQQARQLVEREAADEHVLQHDAVNIHRGGSVNTDGESLCWPQ
jgi:hypothetical protein